METKQAWAIANGIEIPIVISLHMLKKSDQAMLTSCQSKVLMIHGIDQIQELGELTTLTADQSKAGLFNTIIKLVISSYDPIEEAHYFTINSLLAKMFQSTSTFCKLFSLELRDTYN